MHKQLSRTQETPQASATAQALPSLATATPMTAMGSYAYADGVVQRQAAEASVSAPGPQAAAAGGGEDAAAGRNRTGLPDHLKTGIEALSGVSLDRVKVHYNSAAPARLDAHAYAQGSDIHLARGQERHLPHEAWHLVQQAQGRVAPALHARGVPLNEDPLLEREADRMGEAALRMPGDRATRSSHLPTATHGVVQRMPDEALRKLSLQQRQTEAIQSLIRVLANARRWSHNYPLIATTTLTFKAVRSVLHDQIWQAVKALGDEAGNAFVGWWNRGQGKNQLEKYDPYDEDARTLPSAPRQRSDGQDERQLQDWEDKKIADKEMFADLKLSRLIPFILDAADYPDDVKIALKLFFSHTASFIPEGRLGRDLRGRDPGTYFRTSPSLARKGNSDQLKIDYKNEYGNFPRGLTAQVLNQALHGLLVTYGNLPRNIHDAELIADDSNPLLSYAVYRASNKSGTGSLGLIQNVYRTLLSGTQVEPRFGDSSPGDWERTLAGDRFAPIVPEEMLASSNEQNYHDLMLTDRGRLMREVAQEIKARYGEPNQDGRWRVIPIQSQEHASLILEVEYPEGTQKTDQFSEQVWREAFIAIFNLVAEEKGLQTRVTHRGSFGFIYPSVSSVGGPVRIWPGLVPDDVFKELVFATLEALAKNEYWEDSKAPFQAPKSSGSSSPSFEPSTQRGDGVVLHLEALKSAVRYAQDVMRETLTVKGPPGLIDWVSVRLQRNLRKAFYILSKPVREGLKGRESSYLKSAGVIENLMEYSYLLEALRADEAPSNDPYPTYLRDKLGISDSQDDSSHRTTRTFYLDSGMQAIVSAHLLARRWALKEKDAPKKGLRSIDLYTYFEYMGIDKDKLYFLAQNRDKSGYSDINEFWKGIEDEFGDEMPSVISADLNPVFTTRDAVENQVAYQDVFQHFAGSEELGLNLATIPIVDVTNSTLDKVAKLQLGKGYQNFIVVESLSKHQQLGADKFTMGRLTAIGTDAFVKLAGELLGAVENSASHRLPSAYRLRMDRVFYGSAVPRTSLITEEQLAASKQYDAFMALMGLGEPWSKLDRRTAGTPEELQQRYLDMKRLLDIGLMRYVEEIRGDGEGVHNLQKAFQSLPLSEQRHLLEKLEREFGRDEEEEILVENPGMLHAVETGVTNVGNTCYLSAALNMLAFSPYRNLFQPQLLDPKAELRAMIKQVLDKIVADQRVTYDEVSRILAALDHAELLEEPNALANHRALNAHRDPAEVLEYVLNFFGVQENDYLLGQTTHRRLGPFGLQTVDGGDPTHYSDVDALGGYAPVHAEEWMIKLPIANFAGLAQALQGYQAVEQNIELTGVRNRGTDQQRVLRGFGTSRVVFGIQTPPVISIQLIRWVVRHQRVIKDGRFFDMPDQFPLNGFYYHLKTVIYHQGQNYNVGHYTTSTRGDDNNWRYRDDSWVVGDNQNIDRRKGYGYIYTYVRGAAINFGNIALLDPGQPPDPGHQDDEHDRDEQPPPSGRLLDDVDMDGSSSPSRHSGQTQDYSRKRNRSSSPPGKKRGGAKSHKQSLAKLKKKSSKKNEQTSRSESDDDSVQPPQGDQPGKPPRKKKKLL